VREVFAIHVFYADGGPPKSGERRISDLSPKWIGICDDLLRYHGPVMRHNMGSSLSHFDMMGGPVVELLSFGQTCFRLAISLGTGSEQDRAAVSQFRGIWTRLVESGGAVVDLAAIRVLDSAATEQCVLVLDWAQPVDGDEQAALAQLGQHLAGSYFKYCAASGLARKDERA
jgi:hypothetical protein